MQAPLPSEAQDMGVSTEYWTWKHSDKKITDWDFNKNCTVKMYLCLQEFGMFYILTGGPISMGIRWTLGQKMT